MNWLNSAARKKKRLAVGVSSGTSADGIDTALVAISGDGLNTKLELLDFVTYKISPKIKSAILRNSSDETARISEICKLNVLLGNVFADSVVRLCRKNSLASGDELKIDFIGSHGQTIQHLPYGKIMGKNLRSTMQIGDPSVIAAVTGVTTVGDFRIADCAVGGHGAPLVAYLDYILFRSETLNRGLLNIGGIANITVIPKKSNLKDVQAFDTGPGNMLIDGMTKRLFGLDFDSGGKIALRGNLNLSLFRYLKRESFYRKAPPKSTGREVYGEKFQDEITAWSKHMPPENVVRTVTEFTAYSIGYNYDKFIRKHCLLDELIVSGGGAWNIALLESLKRQLGGVMVRRLDHNKITPDSKEAVLFAVLANECLVGNPANIRSATGARKSVILGKICRGAP